MGNLLPELFKLDMHVKLSMKQLLEVAANNQNFREAP
jgi:hypothetical protein